jgi:hypothetical protein
MLPVTFPINDVNLAIIPEMPLVTVMVSRGTVPALMLSISRDILLIVSLALPAHTCTVSLFPFHLATVAVSPVSLIIQGYVNELIE